MNDITHLYELATPVLVAVVAYFLRGLLNTIKKLENDFSKFREEYSGHRVEIRDNKDRIERIEEKLNQYDRDIKLFYMEYGQTLKKIKDQ